VTDVVVEYGSGSDMDAEMIIGQFWRWVARTAILVAGLVLTVNYLGAYEPTIYLDSTPAPARPAPTPAHP
jgi:hypothetical protein